MTFGLTILATAPDTSDNEIRVQALRCAAEWDHPEGDLDARIVAFYEVLRGVHTDIGPASRSEENPWASSPLEHWNRPRDHQPATRLGRRRRRHPPTCDPALEPPEAES
ncbi:hypothetical protein [Promicromonospora soli]|uniref:Uncharacterized protein n=1 Tax=Promicromonospora soli TaxID=2035533 RepID=A0A919KWR7_9MICO|nr:hypothetical protein [Promicromonospora soli]GHH74904.1 hypothetical protein GCM10017772_29940 [Promicromonospora soli]